MNKDSSQLNLVIGMQKVTFKVNLVDITVANNNAQVLFVFTPAKGKSTLALSKSSLLIDFFLFEPTFSFYIASTVVTGLHSGSLLDPQPDKELANVTPDLNFRTE